jgi:hypothetical protein
MSMRLIDARAVAGEALTLGRIAGLRVGVIADGPDGGNIPAAHRPQAEEPMKPLRLVAIALALALVVGSARQGHAQTRVETPGVSGDQLIFYYDATSGHVPFLVVSNFSSEVLTLDVGWYSQDLTQRIATQTLPLVPGGNVILDGSSVVGVGGHAGLTVVTPVGPDGRPIVPPVPATTIPNANTGALTGGFTLADLASNSAFGSNPVARVAVDIDGHHASADSVVDGTEVKYQVIAPEYVVAPFFFNPASSVPVTNRVVLASFMDRYTASGFAIAPGVLSLQYDVVDPEGFITEDESLSFSGVLITDVTTLNHGIPSSSGKLVFRSAVAPLQDGANLFGLISQSLGTFGVGQIMPGYFSAAN